MGFIMTDPVVCVGNEYYGVHMMTAAELTGYLELLRTNPELLERTDISGSRPLIVEPKTMTFRDGSSQQGIHILEATVDIDELKFQTEPVGKYTLESGWRLREGQYYLDWFPCLIPLDRNKASLRKSFMEDNPDGALIEGLFYTIGGHIQGMTSFSLLPPRVSGESDQDLVFADASRKQPLEWIAYRGMLVPRRSICRVLATNYKERAYLPVVVDPDE